MIRLLISSLMVILASNSALAGDLQLKTMIRTNYPDSAKATRYALANYILAGTDYTVYMGKNSPDDVQSIMLNTEIPYYRKGVLTSRIDALLMASGDDTLLIIDEKNKLISFTKDYSDEK